MWNKIKKIALFIALPITVGIVGTLLGNSKQFENVIQPTITPPKIVFPIVWTLLYILMGISSYFVINSKCENKGISTTLYIIQLSINCVWNFFFFRLKWFYFSFILILVLLALVIAMTYNFFKCSKVAGYLQIPYIFWLTFASILTYAVYTLN